MESADFKAFLERLKDRQRLGEENTPGTSNDVFVAKDGRGYLLKSALDTLKASDILDVVGVFSGASLAVSLIRDPSLEVNICIQLLC